MRRLLALVVAGVVLASCGDSDQPAGSITVAAASSLRSAFVEIGDAFTATNPGASVEFTFEASSTLAAQIVEGAPVDVFASADPHNMARLMYLEAVKPSVETFAHNQMAIVVKPGNPAGIEELADLASVGIVSMCGEQVPCGRYTAEVLSNAGVVIDEAKVTRGQNATATLTAVSEGDAVAALVYSTDAMAAGDAVSVVEIPESVNVVGVYPIGLLAAARNPRLAQAFIDFVVGDEGQAILVEHEFLPRP